MATHKAYGGKNESPGKMRVRAQGYELCGRRLWETVHIVIASTDCGDINFLLSLGVKAHNIIACDINPKARLAAEKYGVVISPCALVEDTVVWAHSMGYTIGSINVDLCETMLTCTPVITSVMGSAKSLGIKCVVMYTFQRGRDRTVLDANPELKPDAARQAWLVAQDVPIPYATDDYTSFTGASKGSTMGVYIWLMDGKPGPKRKAKTVQEVLDFVESSSNEVKLSPGKKAWITRMKNAALKAAGG